MKNNFVDSIVDGSKLTNFLCLHQDGNDIYLSFLPKAVAQTPAKLQKGAKTDTNPEIKNACCFVETFKVESEEIYVLLKKLEEIQEECAEFSGRSVQSKIEQQMLAKKSLVWLDDFRRIFREISDCVELNLEDFTVNGSLTILLDPILAKLPFEKIVTGKIAFTHIQRDFSVDVFQSRQKYLENLPNSAPVKEAPKGKKGGTSATKLNSSSDATNFIMLSDRKVPLEIQNVVSKDENFSFKIFDNPGEISNAQLSEELRLSKTANIFYGPSGLNKKECGELNCLNFVEIAGGSVSEGVARMGILLDGGLSGPDGVILLGSFFGWNLFMGSLRSLEFDKTDLIIGEDNENVEEVKAEEVTTEVKDDESDANNCENIEKVDKVRLPTLDLAIELAKAGNLNEFEEDLEAMQKDELDWSVFYGNF